MAPMSLKGPPVFPMGKTLMTGKARKSGVASGQVLSMTQLATLRTPPQIIEDMTPMTTEREPTPRTRMRVTLVTRKTGDPRGPPRQIISMTQLAGIRIAPQCRPDMGPVTAQSGPSLRVGKGGMTGKTGKSGVAPG